MRIKLLVLALLISLAALLVPSPPKVQATPPVLTDCDVVAQVCGDMAEMMYNVCILNGGGLSSCAWMEANYKISCMRGNGCAPFNN